ncbi:SulP family inorganic anion transporter [Methyloprofundus sp.]|uniref:SulP family inorganic anion transporter n=1 Tax=Methyloprofundus sp. TaxID=2020875 RepID=UPI00261EB873|nr:SulP family inorganic anion transporter [Methyloprofundus sp.]
MMKATQPHRSDLGVLSNLRHDIPAGIAVFLVAVPLCLGIAMASGAPLFSGLMAGIMGGILVPLVSRSALGVSGPAAGLAVIVLTAIQDLGFETFLLALVVAGIIQAGMGIAKAGIIGYFFPSSVISGMLAGIGIIIFIKQVPHALGYDRDYEGDLSFFQGDGYNSFNELSHILNFITPGAIIISIISLVILILWELPVMKTNRIFKLFPGSLIAVFVGILISQLLRIFYPELTLETEHLVSIPVAETSADLLSQFIFPDFSQFNNPQVYLTALTLAIVASLETLLCVEAADKLDVDKRVTPTNRELIAQGLANSASGLIGGLPITQVIVRSSANIQAGAKTKASAFVHGLLLLITVMLIPALLNLIPLACLAAILFVVGYKLAKPALFVKMYKTGMYHFIPFLATILGLVFTNLLLGIGIGLVIALLCVLLENYKVSGYYHEEHEDKTFIIRLSEQVSFLNKANILKTLGRIPDHSKVVIDASDSRYIDYDVYEIINNFKAEAKRKDIQLKIINLNGYGSLEPVDKALLGKNNNQSTVYDSSVSASEHN